MAFQKARQLKLDRGQQIVEVVRHAPGQLTHGLHLLSLVELQLHRLLGRDVEQPDPPTLALGRHIQMQHLVGIGARDQFDRPRRSGRQLGPRLGDAGRIEQMTKRGVARRRRAGQDRQGRIGLFRPAGEQVVAADDGRAERRAGGHGAGLSGRRGDGRRQVGRGDGQDRVRRRPHQEPPLGDSADHHLDLALADQDDGAARLALPRLGEGHIEGLGRLAARQGGGGAVGLGPGGVEGQDLS